MISLKGAARRVVSLLIVVSFMFVNTAYGMIGTYTLRSSASFHTGVAPALGRDFAKAASAGVLDQEGLADLYAAQKAGEWDAIQQSGLALRETLVADYRKRWQEKLAQIVESHPHFRAPFDAANPDAQSIEITPDLAELFNILWDMMADIPAGHLKELFAKSDNSTAGIRAYFDVLNNENPSNMYNDMVYALLCKAEAEFLKEVHAEQIKSKVPKRGTTEFDQLIAKLEANLDVAEIDIIKQIYGMEDASLADVVAFVRENPVKLVGGEVRPNSSKLIEIESRMMAKNGITVLTPERHLDADGNPVYDSSTICIFSFLTYKLGACGATFLTPSHSACYILGRKALGPSGQQLLPDTYERYRNIIKRIVKDEIFGESANPIWEMAPADDPHIKHTLTYSRATQLYSNISNLTEEDVALINRATERGHRIKLNNLNGATWKTLLPILEAKGIDPRVFDDPDGNHEVMWKQEDGFFSAGYYIMKIDETAEENADEAITVTQRTDGKISKRTILAKGSAMPEPSTVYAVGHYGIDTTMKKVVNTIPYPEQLRGLPIGMKVYECDPDSDRFVVKQIMPKTARVIALLDKYGIEYYDLGDNRILAAPTPNKIFLTLDIMDYERMQADGTWDSYISLYFITYVSTRAWQEFAVKVGLTAILCRVGFKNLNEAEAIIKDWYEHNVDYGEMSQHEDILEISEERLVIKDQLGTIVTIDRYKTGSEGERIELKLRTHSKEEESGGRVAGLDEPCYNILGETAISMPEKAVPDALMSELFASSKAFLSSDGKDADSREGEYVIADFLDSRFNLYDMKSKIDGRFDILHGDEGGIAQMSTAQEKSKAMDIAGANKINFNNFFFSIGRAVRDGEITLDRAKEILKAVMPKYSTTWDAIENITQTEEPLSGGRTRPEGVPIIMSFTGEDSAALVLEFDFRPSGTDPLKSKIYFDATELSPEQKDEAEEYFNALTNYDLYAVLEFYSIAPSVERPELFAEAGLGPLVLGDGPEIAAPGAAKAPSAGHVRMTVFHGSTNSASILALTDKAMTRQSTLIGIFKDLFRRGPLTMAEAPGRDNAQGEHVDYPDEQFASAQTHLFSMGGALQNSFVAAIAKRDDDTIRIAHANTMEMISFDRGKLQELQLNAQAVRVTNLPATQRAIPVWANHTMGVLMQAVNQGKRISGMDILLTSNIPFGAGLSNSAANCVAVTMALSDAYSWHLSEDEVIAFARDGEHDEFVGSTCGWLDQILVVKSKAGYFAMIDYATKEVTYFKSNLPTTLQRVLVNTNVPHDLVATEYNDRNRQELPRAHAILRALLPDKAIHGSTSLTLAEINHLIKLFDPEAPEVDLTEAGVASIIGSQQRSKQESMDLPDDARLLDNFVKLHYLKPAVDVENLLEVLPRHAELTLQQSFALCLRRMRHQLTSALRTPLTGEAAKAGNVAAFGELIDAEGRSLRESGDYQITGLNGAQDALLDIGFDVGRKLGITVHGRMEGGGGGGNVGFYVDRSDKSKYQQWQQQVTLGYKAWLKQVDELKQRDIEASFIEPKLSEGAKYVVKANSAGELLDLTDIESLNAEALSQAIAASTGNLHDVLTHSQLAAQMHKVAVEGTIAINEDSLPESQKEAIVQIYDKDSPALQELERQTGVTIRLLSQLSAEDIKGGLIMISDQPVSGYEKAKRIGIKHGGLKTTNDYMPLIPMIFMAKVLLIETDAEAIRNALNADGFYRSIFGSPVTVRAILEFLNRGFFELPLPIFDYEAVEMLQRQALAAAIAA